MVLKEKFLNPYALFLQHNIFGTEIMKQVYEVSAKHLEIRQDINFRKGVIF